MNEKDFLKFKDNVCSIFTEAVKDLRRKTQEDGGCLIVGDHKGNVKNLYFPQKSHKQDLPGIKSKKTVLSR